MRLRIVTVAIDLLPALVKQVAGYFRSYARLGLAYVREVLSRNNFYNVKGLSFYHDGELMTTASEGQILTHKGLLVAASILMQSESDVTLDKVGGSNNKKSTYKFEQNELSDLYGSRADSLIIYSLLINNCELEENRAKFGLVPAEDKSNMTGEDQLIISTNEGSLEKYETGWRVAFTMVLLHNLRGLCFANYLHHSSIRRYGDLFADFAKFLTAFLSPSTARIAEFLTTVFQPSRYEMVQAYGRLVHLASHEDRTAVNARRQEPLFNMA